MARGIILWGLGHFPGTVAPHIWGVRPMSSVLRAFSRLGRQCRFEALEPRVLLSGDAISLADPLYVTQPFVPTADNPQQIVRVVVLNFDPRVPSEQNQLMHEVFGWTDPHELAQQFEADLEWATGGAIDIQVVQWRDLDAFPTFTDGFRYNPDQYVANRRAGSGWHDTGTDYYELIESQDLLGPINAGQIDEIWTFGDHYFSLIGEAWMGGPNSFFINGPTFSDAGFDRAIAGYGFNYERGVAEMIHDLCHRTENHGQRAFGSWNLASPQSAFDAFSSNYLETTAGPYGVGTCHVPANADSHYDYGDTRVVDSFAQDFANYPAMTWETQPVSPDTWSAGSSPDYHRDYMKWYFSMMPRNAGTDADGRAANWFKYIWDFNSYEAGTGLGRQEDAFGAGPIVRQPGGESYGLTVRYYDLTAIDESTLDAGDICVIAPGGAIITPSAFAPGADVPTTAGTARTVTYTITPPGGAWDVSDNGTYRIELQSGEVLDTDGNPFPAGEVGSFRVALYDVAAINVSAMLASGQAVATHTPFDIGSVENIFDGNTSTLARTPEINPAVVTLEFDAPQTITGFRSYFAAASGDPAYEYIIEAADSLADLNAQTDSYVQLVPTTGTPSDVFSAVTLASAHSANVFRLTATRLTGDDYVHISEWQLLGTAEDETQAPTGSLDYVDNAARGQTSHFLGLSFADDTAVAVNSINNGDLVITGPGGAITPTFYDVDDYTDGTVRAATFWFIPPGGDWDDVDNGTYTIELQAGAVRDVLYNSAATAQTLGTFDVSVAPPQSRPPSDLAENNAQDWAAWAEGASATVGNDAARTIAGAASVRFDTAGGFDTSLTYPSAGLADWDLGEATELTFSIYAENSSSHNFQEGPRVLLNGTDGGHFEYRYYENDNPATPLNDAVGQWVEFTIPLDPPTKPTGWRRTTAGSPGFDHIRSVEFHADTWDSGFTLWLDGVGFDLPAATVARHVFYNDSYLDGYDPSASSGDDGAIDVGKQALLPGQTATFANYTSFSRGINGIMIDIAGMAGPAGTSDFAFKVGNSADPSTWLVTPPAPIVTVRPAEGVGGSDRVTLIWADSEIVGCWLEVTILSDAIGGSLGLAEDDVFYFGNLPGEVDGDGAVAAADYIALKRAFGSGVTEPGGSADFDCSGAVDYGDLMALMGSFGQSIDMTLSAPVQAASVMSTMTVGERDVVAGPAAVVAVSEPSTSLAAQAAAAGVAMAGLPVGTPAASASLQDTATVFDALANSGPPRLATTASTSPLLIANAAGEVVADVLTLAGPGRSDGPAGDELPDESLSSGLDVGITDKLRMGRRDVLWQDVLAACW